MSRTLKKTIWVVAIFVLLLSMTLSISSMSMNEQAQEAILMPAPEYGILNRFLESLGNEHFTKIHADNLNVSISWYGNATLRITSSVVDKDGNVVTLKNTHAWFEFKNGTNIDVFLLQGTLSFRYPW